MLIAADVNLLPDVLCLSMVACMVIDSSIVSTIATIDSGSRSWAPFDRNVSMYREQCFWNPNYLFVYFGFPADRRTGSIAIIALERLCT